MFKKVIIFFFYFIPGIVVLQILHGWNWETLYTFSTTTYLTVKKVCLPVSIYDKSFLDSKPLSLHSYYKCQR